MYYSDDTIPLSLSPSLPQKQLEESQSDLSVGLLVSKR